MIFGGEDPLEEKIATLSSILACRTPWTFYPQGHKELDATEHVHSKKNILREISKEKEILETTMSGRGRRLCQHYFGINGSIVSRRLK